jgi:DNA-binding transcriptional LysR family regulator
LNLNQLKIFYMAAKNGSLSLAARKLFITQPAVTKGIQRLQEYYDIKFIGHVGKRLVLTDAGEALYAIAEKIFSLESQAEASIRDFQQRKRGHIRILSSESFGDYYLPQIIIQFSKAYPLVQISMDILPTEQVVAHTSDLKNDLGFISYPVEYTKLVFREVLEDRLVIIAPLNHPLTRKKELKPMDLEGQLVVMHEKGSAPRRAIDAYIRKHQLAVRIPLEMSSNRAIKRAVEEGIGIALISSKVAQEQVKAGRIAAIPLSDLSMKRKFYMVHHREKYLSKSLRDFTDTVFEWAGEYAAGLTGGDDM